MTDDTRATLELGVWIALRRLEAAWQRLTSLMPAQRDVVELWAPYRRARAELHAPIADLKLALERALPDPRARPGESAAERMLAALLIHYDERELSTAQGGGAGAGPLLQTEYCECYDGGERFYALLEDALRSPGTPTQMLQLFLFCMRSGFCGRYLSVNDPERLAHQEELCRRVDQTPTANAGLIAPQPERIAGQPFPFPVYAGALALLLAVWLGLNTLAKAHQAAHANVSCKQSQGGP